MDVAFLRLLLSAGESFSLPLGTVWDHGFLPSREVLSGRTVSWCSVASWFSANMFGAGCLPCISLKQQFSRPVQLRVFFCRTTEGSFGSLGRCSNKLVESPVMWCVAIFRVRNFVSVHVCLFSNFTRYVKSAGLWSGQQLHSVSRSDSL